MKIESESGKRNVNIESESGLGSILLQGGSRQKESERQLRIYEGSRNGNSVKNHDFLANEENI